MAAYEQLMMASFDIIQFLTMQIFSAGIPF